MLEQHRPVNAVRDSRRDIKDILLGTSSMHIQAYPCEDHALWTEASRK